MTLPEPFTPEDCDLRGFPFMPLHVQRLRDSELAGTASPEACWAAVLLWCASWHQVPAASVPNNPRLLASLAGYGRDVAAWEAVAAQALHGFVLCSDDRLYHPVVAQEARSAWGMRVTASENGKRGNEIRWAKNRPPIAPRSDSDRPPIAKRSQQTETETGTKTDRQSPVTSEPVDNFVEEPETGEIESAPERVINRPPSFRGGSIETPRGDEAEGAGGAVPEEEINSPPRTGGAGMAPHSAANQVRGASEAPLLSSGEGRGGRATKTASDSITAMAWQVETQLHALGIPDCKRTSATLLEQLRAGHVPADYVMAAQALADQLKRKPGSVKKPFGWILGTVSVWPVAAAPIGAEKLCKPALQAAQDAPESNPELVAKAKAELAALADRMRRGPKKPVQRAKTA